MADGAQILQIATPAKFRRPGRTMALLLTMVLHGLLLAFLLVSLRGPLLRRDCRGDFSDARLGQICLAPEQMMQIKPPPPPKLISPVVPAMIVPNAVFVAPPQIVVAPDPSPLPATLAPAPPAAPDNGKLVTLASFDPAYLAKIRDHVGKFFVYPKTAIDHHAEGVVVVHFRMDRGGHVLFSEIAKSSGYSSLDDEALALLKRAQPLPPMPATMTGDQLDTLFPIAFKIRP